MIQDRRGRPRQQLEHLRLRSPEGTVGRAEVSEMEIALQAMQAQVRLAELELQILEDKLFDTMDE